MTYNFDPDRWYANERSHLQGQLKSSVLNREQFEAALDDLDRRYDDICRRLDGTYRLPAAKE